MAETQISRTDFLDDTQGKTFAGVVDDPEQPFIVVLNFFSDAERQRRMEESELHHDRSPLAGVVRELETHPEIDRFFAGAQVRRNNRFRQAIGVLVRIIMERRGWQKTGRKGSLGVRGAKSSKTQSHNTGGLAFWFLRAERYERPDGMLYESARDRCRKTDSRKSRTRKPKTRSGRG